MLLNGATRLDSLRLCVRLAWILANLSDTIEVVGRLDHFDVLLDVVTPLLLRD